MKHTVVMVTSSYPRFPGDTIGTFMEPIAQGIAARGHQVHLVAPWHPLLARQASVGNLHFHFFRYAPVKQLNVFGYAGALWADTELRLTAYAVVPFALAAGWRATRKIARRHNATVIHAHWMIPSGVIAAAASGRLPLVVSLHGSDMYVAERHRLARAAARAVLRRADWITACSDDLRRRAVAIGANRTRLDVVPYGVDADRFKPDPGSRARYRAKLGVSEETPVVFTAGRLVRKKGFEHLLDAVSRLQPAWPSLMLVIAGGGDLEVELRARASALAIADQVRFAGVVPQPEVAAYLAAADVAVVPSVRDQAGNVDGLPNVVMEALASATPLVTTSAGGIASVARNGETAVIVSEREPAELACAVDALLRDPVRRAEIGRAARRAALDQHGWGQVAERFETLYNRVGGHQNRARQ